MRDGSSLYKFVLSDVCPLSPSERLDQIDLRRLDYRPIIYQNKCKKKKKKKYNEMHEKYIENPQNIIYIEYIVYYSYNIKFQPSYGVQAEENGVELGKRGMELGGLARPR